jgi:hypothetical protein
MIAFYRLPLILGPRRVPTGTSGAAIFETSPSASLALIYSLMIRFRPGLAANSSPLMTSRRLMVTLPVSPRIVTQGPSLEHRSSVWDRLGIGH